MGAGSYLYIPLHYRSVHPSILIIYPPIQYTSIFPSKYLSMNKSIYPSIWLPFQCWMLDLPLYTLSLSDLHVYQPNKKRQNNVYVRKKCNVKINPYIEIIISILNWCIMIIKPHLLCKQYRTSNMASVITRNM